MDQVPANILVKIAEDARPIVRRWWEGLSEKDRRAVTTAGDEPVQNRFFTPEPGDSKPMPLILGGRFGPREQPVIGSEWHADYFEYLLNYPELLLNEEPYYPIGRICIAHEQARAELATGCIHTDFVCPFSSTECPMRHLLAQKPGHSLHLTVSSLSQQILDRRPI